MTWILVAGMAVITFYNRFVFFMRAVPFEPGPRLTRVLEYSMYSVLTAIWAPIVFRINDSWTPETTTPAYLIGAVVAAMLTILKVPSLIVVLVSGFIFFTLHLGW